jgi:hypothetical protein
MRELILVLAETGRQERVSPKMKNGSASLSRGDERLVEMQNE